MPDLAWFDAAAIYLAVLIVSGFSAFVDWRKEKEFCLRAQEERDGKLVSTEIELKFKKQGVSTFEVEISRLTVANLF